MLEDKNQKKTSLAELGEFGLIEHLTKNITINQESTIRSVGDDAAVPDFSDKKVIVKSDSKPNNDGIYTVKSGDSLFSISKQSEK